MNDRCYGCCVTLLLFLIPLLGFMTLIRTAQYFDPGIDQKRQSKPVVKKEKEFDDSLGKFMWNRWFYKKIVP